MQKRVLVLAGHERSLASVALVATLAQLPAKEVRLVGVISVSKFSLARVKAWRRRFGHQFAGRILSELGMARCGPFVGERDFYRDALQRRGIPHRNLKAVCLDLQVPLIRVHDVNSPMALRAIAGHRAGIGVYSGAGILRTELIESFPEGVLNAHCGPLPQVRGMNAVEWSLYFGLQPEVTLHKIDAGIDTGEILTSQQVDVHPSDSLATIRAHTVLAGQDLLTRTLPSIDQIAPKKNPADLGRQYYSMSEPLKHLVQDWVARGITPVADAKRADATRSPSASIQRAA